MEFYREMMEHFQAESASKSAQLSALLEENRALREEIAAMRLSHKEDMDKLRASFEKRLEHMAEINADFSEQLRDALNSGKLARAR